MATAWPDPIQIYEYYLRGQEAHAALKDSLIASPAVIATRSRFFGMTLGEIDNAFRELNRELEHQVVLFLVASAEAALRTDYRKHVDRRFKGPVSKAFRKLEETSKARGKRGVRLDEIIRIWGRHTIGPAAEPASARLIKLLKYRDWLAHGRYWTENKSGLNNPDPYDTWQVLSRFFNAVPELMDLPYA